MTEKELARALIQQGRLSPQQVQEAASLRAPGRDFAQIVVETGWISAEEIQSLDPATFMPDPPMDTAPPQPVLDAPPPTAHAHHRPQHPIEAAIDPTAPWLPPPGAPPPVPPLLPTSHDPYGAPNPPSGGPLPPVNNGSGRIDVGSAIGNSFTLFKNRAGTWISAGILFMLVVYTVACVSTMATKTVGYHNFLLGMIVLLIGNLVTFFFYSGMFRMALKQSRGEPMTIADFFSELEHLPNVALAILLCSVIMYLFAVFFVIPGLIVGELLMFTLPLVIDQNKSATEAIALSYKSLMPNFGAMLLMWLFLFAIHFFGAMFCGLGLLVAVPMVPIAITVMYRDVLG